MYFYLFHILGKLLQLVRILSKCHNDEQDRKTNKDEDRKLQPFFFVATHIFEKKKQTLMIFSQGLLYDIIK